MKKKQQYIAIAVFLCICGPTKTLSMNKSSKIYIAGHTGLVGSALVRILRIQGYTNIITRTHAELDLCRQQDVEDFFRQEQPEFVFVAAARVGGILANATYPVDFLYDNIMIAMNVLNAAQKYGTQKLLFLGSSIILYLGFS